MGKYELVLDYTSHTALQENRFNGKDERKWAVCVGALRSHRTLLVVVTGKHLSAGSTASSSDASAFVVGELSKEGFCTLIQYAERTAVR